MSAQIQPVHYEYEYSSDLEPYQYQYITDRYNANTITDRCVANVLLMFTDSTFRANPPEWNLTNADYNFLRELFEVLEMRPHHDHQGLRSMILIARPIPIFSTVWNRYETFTTRQATFDFRRETDQTQPDGSLTFNRFQARINSMRGGEGDL